MGSIVARMLALLCLLASSLVQGQTLVTAPPNNGSGGVFLDLQPNDGPLTVTGFDTPINGAAEVSVSVEVWVRSGSYAGFTASNAGWTLSQTVTGISQGSSLNTPFALTTPITLAPGGITAVYLHSVTLNSGLRYTGTSGTPPQTTWSNGDLALFSDVARTGNLSFAGGQNSPRTFAGTLRYTKALPTAPNNNGSGGVFLDLQAVDKALFVTGFEVPLGSAAGTPTSIEVWTRAGSYAGLTGSNAGWTLRQTVNGQSQGNTTPARFVLASPIQVAPGEITAVYLHSITEASGIRYSGIGGSPPQTLWTNNDLTLFSDSARIGNIPFAGTLNSPRTFSGSILYTKAFETARPNNGAGGVFLDLMPVDRGVVLNGFDVPLDSAAGTPTTVEVWFRTGSYVGFTGASAGWILRQTITSVSQGTTNPAPFLLSQPIRLAPDGITAVYLHSLTPASGIRYTGIGGSTPQTLWSNGDLVLFSDSARTGNLPFGGALNSPRTFSGVLRYTTERVFANGFESN